MYSIFSEKKLEIYQVLLVLYFWLCRVSSQALELITGVNPKTIRSTVKDLRQIMQEDMLDDDMKVGKKS